MEGRSSMGRDSMYLCGVALFEHDLIPASIHHEYDSSPGHWSRSPNSRRNGSNSLWEIVFIMNTRPDEIGDQ